MIMFNKIKTNSRGFTLIEMMVSVAIFGVMASIIFPALIQFLDARDRIEEKQNHLIGLQKTFLFLAQDMRFASNRVGKDEFGDPGKATLTVNEEALLEFTALYPDLNLDGLGVPRRIRWELDDGVLQRVQYPVIDPDQDTRIIRQILLSGVDDIDITLTKIDDRREEESETWDEQSRLPDLLKMEILFESGIEYNRTFSMLNGDNLDAIAAVQGGNANGAGADNDDSDSDQPGDDGESFPENDEPAPAPDPEIAPEDET